MLDRLRHEEQYFSGGEKRLKFIQKETIIFDVIRLYGPRYQWAVPQLQLTNKVLQTNIRLKTGIEKEELRKLKLIDLIQNQKRVEPLVEGLASASRAEFVDRLADANPLVRWTCADVVGRRQVRVERELIALLRDPEPLVRENARKSLIRLARGSDFGPFPAETQSEDAIRRWTHWLSMQSVHDEPAPDRVAADR